MKTLVWSVIGIFLSIQLSAQCLQGDCWDGIGTFLYPSGAKFEGEFKNGKINGFGTLYFSKGDVYEGEWVDHYREGRGKMTFKNGNVYVGGFKKSVISGQGTMNYYNGDRYTGNFENSQPWGLGNYFFYSGEKYEGNFVDGKFDGKGTMFYKDGSQYQGNWKENQKHGEGTFTDTEGLAQTGNWIDGTLEGNAEIAAAIQEASDGLTNCNESTCNSGKGIYTYADGTRYIGNFLNGNAEGSGTVFYTNGDRYEGGWSGHAPHGEGTIYFSTGKVFGGVWNYGVIVQEISKGDPEMKHLEVKPDVSEEIKVWAVVAGVGDYEFLPKLNYTDDDAFKFFAFLKSPEGGALPDEQIRLLIDHDVTRDKMLTAMQEVFFKADDNDVVIFYFSGHGLEGSFLPVNYNGFHNKLQHDEVKEILNKCQAKQKIVFADACHSGSLLAMNGSDLLAAKGMQPDVDNTLKHYYGGLKNATEGMAFIMSSQGGEYSLEDTGLRSGIFSHFLLRGLKGEANSDENDVVTIDEIFNYVLQSVSRYTMGVQTPALTGKFDKSTPVAGIRR